MLTRPDAAVGPARQAVAVAGGPAGRASTASRCCSRRGPTPRVPRRLRELAPDCCPVVAYGALLPRAAARRAHARLGQPALLAAARLARAPRRCSARSRPATRSPAPRRSGSSRPWTPARSTAWSPRRSGPPTPPATCSTGSPISGAALLVATLDGIADGSLTRRCRSRPTASPSRPKITVEDARVRLGPARPRGRPADPRGHARPRRLDDVRRAAGQARPGDRRPTTPDAWRPASCAVEQRRRAGRHRHRSRCVLGEVQPPGKKPMAAADWARGARLDEIARRRRSDQAPATTAAQPRRKPLDPARRGGVRRAARGRRARRLRQPGAAGAAARARHHRPRRRVRHRAGLRHLPHPRPARRGHRRGRGPAARQHRPACCSTCCGWAPTSCCAPGSRRTPRSSPPSSWRASIDSARPASSTPCCARIAGRDETAWVDELAPAGRRRPGRARWRSCTRTRAGSRRRSPTRSARDAGRAGRAAGQRQRAPVGAPGRPARRADRRGAGRRRSAARSAATRRTRCTCPAATPASSPPSATGRRGAGRGQPAGGPRADAGRRSTARRRALARPVRRAGRQGRRCWRRSPAERGARLTAVELARAPRRPGRAERRAACRSTCCASTAATPGLRAAASTGCWSTRRAPGWARCGAGRRRAGGAARRRAAAGRLQRELLAVGARG